MLLPSILKALEGGSSGARSLDSPSRILLVKQSERMGNIILMNAGIAGLRQAFPEARIDLLLPAAYADLMLANRHLDYVIPAEKRKYIIRPWALINLLSEIRKNAYDLAINCSDINSHSSTEASYTILAGARMTAGWKVGNGGLFDIEVDRYAEVIHATQMYVRLFSGIFGRHIEGDPYFGQLDSRLADDHPIIGVNCGGRGSKRVPLEHFLAIGNRLAREGVQVEFILGPDEAGLRAKLAPRLGEGCALLAPMSLKDLKAVFMRYRAFVSSDTGPMHLAWIMGIPTVAIFIDSELEKFRPLSPGSLALDGRNGIDLDRTCHHLLEILKTAGISQ
ncbi:MAG: hypothetical protein A2W25_14505 [candidate division Zixibacteria bacterium RBG_16_53_22]|nr:MAG: hypothetical protein A2W25_14505 [candidate division Zixibacteria bacterium RBG_16_53_22]